MRTIRTIGKQNVPNVQRRYDKVICGSFRSSAITSARRRHIERRIMSVRDRFTTAVLKPQEQGSFGKQGREWGREGEWRATEPEPSLFQTRAYAGLRPRSWGGWAARPGRVSRISITYTFGQAQVPHRDLCRTCPGQLTRAYGGLEPRFSRASLLFIRSCLLVRF